MTLSTRYPRQPWTNLITAPGQVDWLWVLATRPGLRPADGSIPGSDMARTLAGNVIAGTVSGIYSDRSDRYAMTSEMPIN